MQVTAAPKRKPKPSDQNSEEVRPKTAEELARERQPELLKLAATCRTHSIELSAVEYASELSNQLLSHAGDLETCFKDVQKALDEGAEEEGLNTILEKANRLEAVVEKAKAR